MAHTKKRKEKKKAIIIATVSLDVVTVARLLYLNIIQFIVRLQFRKPSIQRAHATQRAFLKNLPRFSFLEKEYNEDVKLVQSCRNVW